MAENVPRIKVTDLESEREAVSSQAYSLESPRVGEPSHVIRPKSSSSEGNALNGNSRTPAKLTRNTSSKTNIVAATKTALSTDQSSTAIDPLSHHILKRTNTENTIPQRLRSPASPESSTNEINAIGGTEAASSNRLLGSELPVRVDSIPLKEKKKAVSFLSRFSIIAGKKKEFEDVDDDESEPGDVRTEGMNAHVFSSEIDSNGYIPKHKEPPRYIKVRAHNKKEREFNRMFLAQELSGSKPKTKDDNTLPIATPEAQSRPSSSTKGNAVWSAEFSKDGKYFAAAGQDQVVRVWSVISTEEERIAHEQDEDASGGKGERLSAPVFRSKPIREFEGHTSVILDLSWSKNNFLLSSSMDKTVRLWHISRDECLCTFKHKDFVTSISFHPRDDRFFLAGSLDSILRLWSIPDKKVAFWSQLPDLITAVAFTPDGKTAMAGVHSGLCLFYETEGLKYHTQIHVRSSRGKNAKGSKITGIQTLMTPQDLNGEVKVLITSNDSRVRMYNLRDKTLIMKFRGHENTCSQIKATFSDDMRYIICGSEDRKTYIWSTQPPDSDTKDKRPVEHFEAHSDMVTTTVIAPLQTRQLLGHSGDPIYDLCNPPPVTLLSRAESIVSSRPTMDGEKRHSDPIVEPAAKKPEESPAYLARSAHKEGNIIITADYNGTIKVFRQDCAFQKRLNDKWETGSTFSKRLGTNRIARTGSTVTRVSAGSQSHSRRNSASQNSINTQPQSDRILSWRNSINTNASVNYPESTRTVSSPRIERSTSPSKVSRTSTTSLYHTASNSTTRTLASTARQKPYAKLGTPSISTTTSPPHSIYKSPSPNVSQPPTPGFSIHSVSDSNSVEAAGKNYNFWNLQNWKRGNSSGNIADENKLGNDLSQGMGFGMERQESVLSKLTDEEETDDEYLNGNPKRLQEIRRESTAEAQVTRSDDEAITCRNCGGKDLRAKKASGGRGVQKLICARCGNIVG